MKYSYIQELTDSWVCDYRVPNHTYIMMGSKCVGYIKEGTAEQIFFNKPLTKFDKRGRKFKEVKV